MDSAAERSMSAKPHRKTTASGSPIEVKRTRYGDQRQHHRVDTEVLHALDVMSILFTYSWDFGIKTTEAPDEPDSSHRFCIEVLLHIGFPNATPRASAVAVD